MRFILLLLPLFLYANPLQVGSEVKPIILKSQYKTEHKLTKNGIWIISWNKKNSRVANSYFNKFGMRKNINFIVDTASAPSFIFKLFALPELQEYKHTILLSDNELFNKTLPYKEGFFTILYIKNQEFVYTLLYTLYYF